MKRLPVTLFIEEAPVDPFTPKGDQQYRLVAVVPARETEVILSEANETVLHALLDAFNEGVFEHIKALGKDFELMRYSNQDTTLLIGSLSASIALHRRQLDHVRRALRALFTWTQAVTPLVRTKKAQIVGVGDRCVNDDADWWWAPEAETIQRRTNESAVRFDPNSVGPQL